MLFLVEMDRVKSGITPTPESGRVFIEQIIFPTLARAEQLVCREKDPGGRSGGRPGCAPIHYRGSLVAGG